MERASTKGNWFPEAFVGSMGALQSYVEGSTRELPIGFESAYEPWRSLKRPIAQAPGLASLCLSERPQR